MMSTQEQNQIEEHNILSPQSDTSVESQELGKIANKLDTQIDNKGLTRPGKISKTSPKKVGQSESVIPTVVVDTGDEERSSDNGTYVVEIDAECHSARRKIDELFGVMKSAEASIVADAKKRDLMSSTGKSDMRSGRLDTKLSRKNSSESHCSVTSLQNSNRFNPRGPVRSTSRTSLCDDHKVSASRPHSYLKRSASQTNYKSSLDTHSKSLDLSSQVKPKDSRPVNVPTMKFNRAFALRRARLGLGEPGSDNSTCSDSAQSPSSFSKQPLKPHNMRTDNGTNFTARRRGPSAQASSSSNFSNGDTNKKLLGSHLNRGLDSPRGFMPTASTPKLEVENQENHSVISDFSGLLSRVRTHRDLGPQSRSAIILKRPRQVRGLDGSIFNSSYPNGTPTYSNNSLVTEYSGTTAQGSLASEEVRSSLNSARYLTNSGQSQYSALDSLVVSAISNLSAKLYNSICDVLVKQAQKLPTDNETRQVLEDILPQINSPNVVSRSQTLEEIDQSIYCELSQTLKNLRKTEQIVGVIAQITHQLPEPCAEVAVISN